MSTVPHFPLYCPDWIQDTAFMSHEAKGLFIDLLCYCWLHEGLPTDERELAKLARMDLRKFKRVWNEIKHKFVQTSPELIENLGPQVSEKSAVLLKDFSNRSLRYWNPRLLKEMLQLAERQEKRRAAGQQGGLSKARNLLSSKSKQKATKSYPYPYIKEKEEKEKDNRASPSTVDFSKIEGLNVDAWDEWLAYRAKMKFKKYKTTSLAKKIAKLPKLAQLNCIEHSIENQYQGLFPDKFSKPINPAPNGNGFDQPPPRAQPPDASSLKNDHSKKWTQAERNNAKKLIRQAKDKAGIPSEPDEKQTIERPTTMAELLMAAKHCHAAYELQGKDCGQLWEFTCETQTKHKCYWCEKFERQRNGPAKKDSTKTLGNLI